MEARDVHATFQGDWSRVKVGLSSNRTERAARDESACSSTLVGGSAMAAGNWTRVGRQSTCLEKCSGEKKLASCILGAPGEELTMIGWPDLAELVLPEGSARTRRDFALRPPGKVSQCNRDDVNMRVCMNA